jgi:hypothetical protein
MSGLKRLAEAQQAELLDEELAKKGNEAIGNMPDL